MPVINSYDKPASAIRKGNYLFGQKVVDTKPKRVKTEIMLDAPVDGKTWWEFRLTDMLSVGVEELTPEELALKEAQDLADRKKYFIKSVKDFSASAHLDLREAEAKQKQRRENGWGLLDHYVADLLLSAWAVMDLAREIDAVFASAADGTFHLHEGEHVNKLTDEGNYVCTVPNDYDDYAVAVHIVNRLANRLTTRAMSTRVLSRSTSVTMNLCEDLETQALAIFLRSMQYSTSGLPEVKLPSQY